VRASYLYGLTVLVVSACALPELTQDPTYDSGLGGGGGSDSSSSGTGDGPGIGSVNGGHGGGSRGGNGNGGGVMGGTTATGGAISGASCKPGGPPSCFDANTPQVCGDEGQWLSKPACPADAPLCDPATAGCVVCAAGSFECQSNESMKCRTDGSGWDVSESCAGAKPACLAASGLCGRCQKDDTQCSFDDVQTCGADSLWSSGVACPSDTPECVAGACQECDASQNNGSDCQGSTPRVCVDGKWKKQTACSGDEPVCDPTTAQCLCKDGDRRGQFECLGGVGREECRAGKWVASPDCGGWPCLNNSCFTPPSCKGMAGTECAGQSCCEKVVVPAGTFKMGAADDESGANSNVKPEHQVTLSAYGLDKFEVTVGRFRRFVADWKVPTAGAGDYAGRVGSGWDSAWDSLVDSASFSTASCSARTWTSAVGGNEDKPMNCVTWAEAYAFCIWDGGRLPTEAEWEYAAAGGSENRIYPWGDDRPTCEHANYGDCGKVIAPVGSLPKGTARWGNADMAGNVWEYMRDLRDWDFYKKPEAGNYNALNLVDPEDMRMIRGASYDWPESYLYATGRDDTFIDQGTNAKGFRCARSP
jgi:formylglycine-generating enzyme